jgi:hypothetical protein
MPPMAVDELVEIEVCQHIAVKDQEWFIKLFA